ncbi:hypothetical protein DSO57_1024656 [Entomophthora muscae]|uniref:Uncharacterized protein n=1 Tax=Entomophthora muscae TaxID=34485 RepID=A0ACC2UC24_9FUNG|nr:hypothetical protein DSO57_1024656 [Entomophthora muscae]
MEFDYSQFEPANELTPVIDATDNWKNLVNNNTWAKEICKVLPMTDGHTYTLDCQEVVHCYFIFDIIYLCGFAPHTQQPQETADQPPNLYHPLGAPYGPVHFTKYPPPPNPVYSEFTLEKILIYDPEARTRETKTVYREGNKITTVDSVATEVQTLPANVSYNTQGALDELPLDVSNVINESDGNGEWQALHPN